MPNSYKACCLTLFHIKTGQCCPPPSLEECSSLELNDEAPPPPVAEGLYYWRIYFGICWGGGTHSVRS